jgi:hypothetical protein
MQTMTRPLNNFKQTAVCIMTCKRRSAKHCVKDDFAFLWKHLKFGTHRTEIPGPIKTKLRTADLIDPQSISAKIGEDRMARDFSTNG